MHRISRVSICNYRSCINIEADISDFTALVGYNNGGKSNILSAIKWGIKGSSLQSADYNNPEEAVSVTLKIDGISEGLLDKLDQKHRPRIEPYCQDSSLSIRRIQPTPGGSAKSISLEVLDKDGEWKKNPTGIDAAIAALFPEPIEIGAMENATEDISKSKTTTTIGKLIAEVIRPIEEQHGAAIQVALEKIKRKLDAEGEDRAPELVALDNGTNENLSDIFPGLKVRVHVPPPEIKEMLKSGTIKVFEEGDPTPRDVDALGHGAQRSIQMALIRHLATVKRSGSSDPSRTLLLVDEPELYLHPHGIEQVRQALKLLSRTSYQVIFSTHSPLMIRADDIATALIIWKSKELGTTSKLRLADAIAQVVADAPSQTELLFEFHNLSQVLFNERVILAEGRTEARIIPYLYETIRGKSLGSARIGFVCPNGSGNMAKCMKILDAMCIHTRVIVDLDFVFREAINSEILPADDGDIKLFKDILGKKADGLSISLAEDGFPKSSDTMSSARSFELLATDTDLKPIISRLQDKLIKQRYWLWKMGTFESHLGISGKKIGNHSAYISDLRTKGYKSIVSDYIGIEKLIAWIDN